MHSYHARVCVLVLLARTLPHATVNVHNSCWLWCREALVVGEQRKQRIDSEQAMVQSTIVLFFCADTGTVTKFTVLAYTPI